MKTWFKFYGQEYLSDPKMLSLSPVYRALWLTMLCLASASDEEGVIKYISEQKIMMLTGIETRDDEWEENEGFLEVFEKLKMIHIVEDRITILNFEKRQETNLTNAERQARYRSNADAKKKVTQKKNGDVTKVTLDKNRIDKNREDNNTVTEKNGILHNLPDQNISNLETLSIKDDILSQLKDKQSESFYYRVASKLPSSTIYQFLSEVKQEGRDQAKLFTHKVKEYAQKHD